MRSLALLSSIYLCNTTAFGTKAMSGSWCRVLDAPNSQKLSTVLQHVRESEPMPLGGGVMYYHKQKPPGRLPKVVEEGLTAKDLLDDGVGKEPWQTLTVALLYLGCGGLDETHDTVQ
eukprot:6895-Heterococcus_DN1.PRE.1